MEKKRAKIRQQKSRRPRSDCVTADGCILQQIIMEHLAATRAFFAAHTNGLSFILQRMYMEYLADSRTPQREVIQHHHQPETRLAAEESRFNFLCLEY